MFFIRETNNYTHTRELYTPTILCLFLLFTVLNNFKINYLQFSWQISCVLLLCMFLPSMVTTVRFRLLYEHIFFFARISSISSLYPVVIPKISFRSALVSHRIHLRNLLSEPFPVSWKSLSPIFFHLPTFLYILKASFTLVFSNLSDHLLNYPFWFYFDDVSIENQSSFIHLVRDFRNFKQNSKQNNIEKFKIVYFYCCPRIIIIIVNVL